MLISELGIRGFKSYGNNEQILKLNANKTNMSEFCLIIKNKIDFILPSS